MAGCMLAGLLATIGAQPCALRADGLPVCLFLPCSYTLALSAGAAATALFIGGFVVKSLQED